MSNHFPFPNRPVSRPSTSNEFSLVKPSYEVINVEPFQKSLKLKNNISNDIVIDSRDRDCKVYKDPSLYTIYLPNTYRNVLYLRLKKTIIPKTHYPIDINNNVIYLKEFYDYQTFTEVKDISIPIGNYIKENFGKGGDLDLMDVLSNTLTQNSSFNIQYVFSYNELTDSVRIQILQPNAMVEFFFGDGKKYNDNSIGESIGFSPKIFKSTKYFNNIIEGDQVINLNLNNFCYLQINAYNNIEGPREISGSPTFLIPLDCKFGDYSIYLAGNYLKEDTKYFNPIESKINRIDISFLTYNNKPFSFHGANHLIEFELYQTNYKKKYE